MDIFSTGTIVKQINGRVIAYLSIFEKINAKSLTILNKRINCVVDNSHNFENKHRKQQKNIYKNSIRHS